MGLRAWVASATVTLPAKLPAVEAHRSGSVAPVTAEYSLMARSG